jgi:hypothetical protein
MERRPHIGLSYKMRGRGGHKFAISTISQGGREREDTMCN